MTTPAPPLAVTAGRLIAWIAAGVVCTRAVIDPDLWGHVRFGLDVLASGHLSSIDPYSFTQDVPWVNHEWLSELCFALAYRAGGMPGLLVLKIVVLAAAFALMARVVLPADQPARWWLLAAGIIGAAPAAMTIRPQIWTVLGLTVLCWILRRGRRGYWLVPLFALWANMHGGWIVGVGVAGLWLSGECLDTRSVRAVVPRAAALGAAVIATLVNPYGWRLWMFLFSTVHTTRDITEWRPLWQQDDGSNLLVWALVAIGVVGTTALKRGHKLTWAAALPVAWLGMMSLVVARLLPLFSVVAACCLAAAWCTTSNPVVQPRAASLVLVDVTVVALACGLMLLGPARCLPIEGTWVPDLDAARSFTSTAVRGRLVLPFDWGEYAIWHWGPRLRISIDGRRETVYSDDTLRVQTAVARGRLEGIGFLGRIRPEYVWLPATTAGATKTWLRGHGYRVDVETAKSFIATRADIPPLAPGAPLSRCFP